ncbi:MAG: 3-hydroxyacyl-ACP dehydratase FabZ family protein [Candidatus Binatia bacterium]
MRFVLFDRIVEFKKNQRAVLLKNVSQSEDYFTDHFPGFPVVPGSIILGTFEQGAEVLLGASFDFSLRPVLRSLSRASFRHFVLPGDQLEVSLSINSTVPTRVEALAEVDGKRVASAVLEFAMESPDGNAKVREACERLKVLYKLLTDNPIAKVWDLWERQG